MPQRRSRRSKYRLYPSSHLTSDFDSCQQRPPGVSELWSIQGLSLPAPHGTFQLHHPLSQAQQTGSESLQPCHRPAAGSFTTSSSSGRRESDSPSPGSFSCQYSAATSQTSISEPSLQMQISPPRPKTPAGQIRPQNFCAPARRRQLPALDEFSRCRVLHILAQAESRAFPGQESLITDENHLLSLEAMQAYSDLFFTKFNTCYPLIHQATFEPRKMDPLLLLSVLLLGPHTVTKTLTD